jgi:hypothetical protein
MAKKDMVAERKDRGVDDEVFAGNDDGAPSNGPKESGGGAGETTRLAEGPKGQYRTAVSDNPGNAPYMGGSNSGKGNTKQDDAGTAKLYASPDGGGGVGDEHQESAVDGDVDGYYRSLSQRRPPNYSKNANLQAKQAPLDLAPVDGGDGFVGSNTGPAVNFNYITGKKGFSEDMPVWEEVSSFKDYPDMTGSTTPDQKDIKPAGEDSRDEFAPWKHVETDEGFPQTAYTATPNGGTPPVNDEPDQDGIFGHMGGSGKTSYKTDLNVQSIPSDESGDTDTTSLPTTEFTHNDGGGAPIFKFSGQTPPESQYMPKPRD